MLSFAKFFFVSTGLAFLMQRLKLLGAFAGALIAVLFIASSSTLTENDIRDATREAAAILHEEASPGTPVLHASAHTFWNLRAYDANPSRHLLMISPEMPALPRLLYGRKCLATPRDLAGMQEVWAVYGEWRFGPPTVRERLEPLWFANWTYEKLPVFMRNFVKMIEIAQYKRRP